MFVGFFAAKRDVTLPHLKMVLLSPSSVLLPVKTSTPLTLTQGLWRHLVLFLCMQQPLLVAQPLHILLQTTIRSHVTIPPPLLLTMEKTVWPYPPSQITPKVQVGHLQVKRRLMEV